MNEKRLALALISAPLVIFVVLLVLLFGGAGANTTVGGYKGIVLGPGKLKPGSVPDWAEKPLLKAAQTCPEMTAPILAAQDETESNWNPKAHNAGSGADGLAQFIPSTWATWGIDGDGDGKADPEDPADAIATQASYLCYLVHFVKDASGLNGEVVDLALAAYNAGPGNVQQYKGIPPFPETTKYVTNIRDLAAHKYSVPDIGSAGPVVQAAAKWIGTMYAWGGGTLDGPSAGSAPDVGVIGFDCSALVRYAYYQGSNQMITLPRTAQAQFDATKTQQVPANQLQPGDLLFWGKPTDSGGLHHVALYVGDGQLIEAPQSGQKINRRPFAPGGDFYGATRVFGGPLDHGDLSVKRP